MNQQEWWCYKLHIVILVCWSYKHFRVKNTTVSSAVAWSNLSLKLVHYLVPVFSPSIFCMSCCTQFCLGSAQSVFDLFSLKLFGDQKMKNEKKTYISLQPWLLNCCVIAARQPSVTGIMNSSFPSDCVLCAWLKKHTHTIAGMLHPPSVSCTL